VLFTQIEFFVFFAAVVGCFHLASNNLYRKLFLLIASYYFYAYWDYRFVPLLVASTGVDYLVGRGLGRASQPFQRRLLLAVSLAANIGTLFVFKYFNFFVASLDRALSPLHVGLSTMNLVLPVGISFYTFEKLSYILDVWRGKLKPCESLLDFAVFVAFFPRLIAGPIIRASDFLPQLRAPSRLSADNSVIGLRLLILGLFKKVFLADRLAMFVDPVFESYTVYDSATIWLAVLAYAIQIYCDFSGYSDMAIGAARILGYELNGNFNFPYLAENMQDFWRRWHISLSSWIRDYVYIPLGGSRKGAPRTVINTMTAMFLCGLWHGAAWTFVAWGLFHGAALTLHRVFRSEVPSESHSPLSAAFNRLLTLLAICVGWVLFRSRTFTQAWGLTHRMFSPVGGIVWLHPFVLFVVFATLVYHVIVQSETKALDFVRLPEQSWYTPAALFSLVWLVIVFHAEKFRPFIYFQF
jgi:alginate O-acetyltransferase complex protein AlgI